MTSIVNYILRNDIFALRKKSQAGKLNYLIGLSIFLYLTVYQIITLTNSNYINWVLNILCCLCEWEVNKPLQ